MPDSKDSSTVATHEPSSTDLIKNGAIKTLYRFVSFAKWSFGVSQMVVGSFFFWKPENSLGWFLGLASVVLAFHLLMFAMIFITIRSIVKPED